MVRKDPKRSLIIEPSSLYLHMMGGFSRLFPRPLVWENWDEAPQPAEL